MKDKIELSNGVKKFLIISPHPDDSDFGAAGTVAKLVQEGNAVEYLIVSDGSKGSHKVGFGGKKLAAVRQKEQKTAAQVVGVKNVTFLGQVDGEIENTKQLRKKLVREIRRIKPDIVVSFDPSSLQFENVFRSHRDHRMVAEAVFDAIYPAAGSASFFPEVLAKGLKPHQIKEVWFYATSFPTKWVDISRTLELKIKALCSHKSQVDKAEFEELIRKNAEKNAKSKKMKYAECFRVVDFNHD